MQFPQPGQNEGVRRSRVYREQQALHLLAQASVRFCGHALESCRALEQQHELAATCACACITHHMCLLYLGKHTQCTRVLSQYLSLSDLMAFKVVRQCSKQFCPSLTCWLLERWLLPSAVSGVAACCPCLGKGWVNCHDSAPERDLPV